MAEFDKGGDIMSLKLATFFAIVGLSIALILHLGAPVSSYFGHIILIICLLIFFITLYTKQKGGSK